MTPRDFEASVTKDIVRLMQPVLPLKEVAKAYSMNPSVPSWMYFPVYKDAAGRFWYENTQERSLWGPFRFQRAAQDEAEVDIGGYDYS